MAAEEYIPLKGFLAYLQLRLEALAQQQEKPMSGKVCNWLAAAPHALEGPNNWGIVLLTGSFTFFLTKDQSQAQAIALCKALNALLGGKKAVVVLEEKTPPEPP